MRRDFIPALQRKVAISAIPTSALRGQGRPGLIASVRTTLSNTPLDQFGVASPQLFAARLDGLTDQLRGCMGKTVVDWGVARKAANLFLRDAFYNAYLQKRYRLDAAEALYELPLDKKVAVRLAACVSRKLPDWEGVKYLNRQDSDIYQEEAAAEAARRRIARVHLDVYFWVDPAEVGELNFSDC